MSDILLRGNSMDGGIRVFAAITTDLVNEAQRIHKTYPTATAALGRTLTMSAIMGAGLKNPDDSVTIQFKGDGPLGNIVAVCNNKSEVRGYVANPYVDIPRKDNGKLDVGTAVGKGFLSVIRDLGMKEPYIGQVPIVTGEIAEDILFTVTDGFDMLISNKSVTPKYKCYCSKERMEKALISIGKTELEDLIREQGSAELTCQFCDNRYTFDKTELEKLLKEAK